MIRKVLRKPSKVSGSTLRLWGLKTRSSLRLGGALALQCARLNQNQNQKQKSKDKREQCRLGLPPFEDSMLVQTLGEILNQYYIAQTPKKSLLKREDPSPVLLITLLMLMEGIQDCGPRDSVWEYLEECGRGFSPSSPFAAVSKLISTPSLPLLLLPAISSQNSLS